MQCMIAHLVIATLDTARTWIESYAKEHNIPPQYRYTIEPVEKELSIAQIRELQKETAYRVREGRLFVIDRFETAAEEAQNAMLKMLEQPQETDHFILLCTNEQRAIATIRSRARTIRLSLASSPTTSKTSKTQLGTWRTATTDEDAKAYIDQAIDYERQMLRGGSSTTTIRRLISLRQLLNNHVTAQSVTDCVTLLYLPSPATKHS